MFRATVSSLTRSLALRVPIAVSRTTLPNGFRSSSHLFGFTSYRAFSNSPLTFSPAAATKRKPATRAKPKKTGTKPKTKAQVKSKTKKKPAKKTQARAKTAKPKDKPVSTFVPLEKRPPRRPMPGFFIYYNRTRDPNTPILEGSKAAAASWAQLSEAEKEPYIEEYRARLENYYRAREKWIQDPNNQEILKTLNKDRKKKGKTRIMLKPRDYQKRPLSAFFRFIEVCRKDPETAPEKTPAGKSHQTWVVQQASRQWKELPGWEKAKYMQEYKDEMGQFKRSEV